MPSRLALAFLFPHGCTDRTLSPCDLPRESVARDSWKRRRPMPIVKSAKRAELSRFHRRGADSSEKRLAPFFLPIASRSGRESCEILMIIDRCSWNMCPYPGLIRKFASNDFARWRNRLWKDNVHEWSGKDSLLDNIV